MIKMFIKNFRSKKSAKKKSISQRDVEEENLSGLQRRVYATVSLKVKTNPLLIYNKLLQAADHFWKDVLHT